MLISTAFTFRLPIIPWKQLSAYQISAFNKQIINKLKKGCVFCSGFGLIPFLSSLDLLLTIIVIFVFIERSVLCKPKARVFDQMYLCQMYLIKQYKLEDVDCKK